MSRCNNLTFMHGITSFVNCYPYAIQGIAYFTMCSCFSKRGRHIFRGGLIATNEELGGAPSEGGDVASSSFPSITNRGLSNQ